MTQKRKTRKKHQPQRTCVGCRNVQTKRAMVRIVRTSEGVQIDPSGKIPGRGAYLHEARTCWEKGLKGTLAQALKAEISLEDRKRLSEFMLSLPEEALTQNHDAE